MTFEEIVLEYDKISADYTSARIPIPRLLLSSDALDMYIVEAKKLIVDQHNKSLTGSPEDGLRLMSMIAKLVDMAILSGNIHGFVGGVNFVVAKSVVPINYLI